MTSPTTWEIALRIAAALIGGSLLGIERETHGRAAGFRTTLLVCVASAITMIISEILFVESATSSWRPDPARLGAGLLAGMGFLGAATIIRHANVIRGVTTAATLWFSTILGMTFGAGQFVLAGMGLGVALFTLLILPSVEKCLPIDWYAEIIVSLEQDAMPDPQLKERLESFGLQIKSFDLDYDIAGRKKTISCEVKLRKTARFELSQKVVSELSKCQGVLQIKWQ